MARPATDLEDLGPPDDDPAALSRRRASQVATARTRLGLSVGGVVFTLGGLIQILAVAWFGLLIVLLGGSAEVLVHTGGLESRTFATCSIAATVLDAALLLAIATGSARRCVRSWVSSSSAPPRWTSRRASCPTASASGR